MQTISFYTLGCRLNQSETAVIENTFKTDQFKIVDFDEPADIAVINTCTVTENGDADTRYLVNKANRLNPQVKIALVGCQAQIQKEKLTKLPNVRWVVGNAKKIDLKNFIATLDTVQVIAPTIPKDSFTIPVTAIDKNHTRANLKIQDGCDFFCSFCEIPYARGRARSRFFDDIIKEARLLIEHGHKEIILTGINIGTYQEKNKTFMDVIDVLEKLDGLKRHRISSIEPTTVPEELIERMVGGSKLCRYLHLPLQSASNHILNLMKRKYTLEEYNDFIVKAKTLVEEICIGTDIIVGFPGETEEEFQKTFDYLLNAPIDYFHVFSYSNRHLAKSHDLEDKISKQTIHRRSETLRQLSRRKQRMFFESLRGSEQTVLFEKRKRGILSGLTDHYVRVVVDTPQNLSNQIHKVKIKDIQESSVLGQLI